MSRRRRIPMRELLAEPEQRRDLMVETLIATQAREGIETTREQAERAYDRVQEERHHAESNPGMMSVFQRNKGGVGAEDTFKRFHARDIQPVYPFHRRDEGVFDLPLSVKWPDRVTIAGEAGRTLYESDKWHKINDTTQYYHDHNKGCVLYVPVESDDDIEVDFPFEYPDEVMLVGECIGFTFKDLEGETVDGVMQGKNILVSSPDSWVNPKRPNYIFLAIINLDGGGVEGLITGPKLRITAHGIEG
jgi:hypothetical protein